MLARRFKENVVVTPGRAMLAPTQKKPASKQKLKEQAHC